MNQKTTTMATSTDPIACELLKRISLQNRRPQPAYLSEADAVSIQEYSRSVYADRYVLDTVNLYWPGRLNRNHMYDLFAVHLPHNDSGKTRIDMLNFVTENKARYKMDCHTVLKMHELNLDTWSQWVVCFENGVDELAIYAMSDMVQVHTTILTKSKPWTTLHPDLPIQDTFQMLEICAIKLVYLGDDQYGILRTRPSSCTNPILVHAPVFPTPSPVPALEAPSQRDLETADTLLAYEEST